VQMWSSEAVVDGEEKVKQRHAVSMDRERWRGGREAWTEGPGG
jgi:hypothetical protein